MIRAKESTAVLVTIVVAICALAGLMFVMMGRLSVIQNEIGKSNSSAVDVSGWETYRNNQYGFELEYPSQWVLDTNGLSGETPFVVFGNPLAGTKTYSMSVFIEKNPGSFSSGGYVHAQLNAYGAVDAPQSGGPTLAPHFQKTYAFMVGGYPAYELYGVFDFDRNSEWVYVAHAGFVLRFDFPVAEENPNLSLPVANNEIARGIMNTLVFTN
jgi:hypothetical protein